jgi:hypothetical protein
VSHVLNPRHRVLAFGTGRHADHSVPILRRCDGARPHDPQTWSATGKAYFRLPFLQPGRYKGSKAGAYDMTLSGGSVRDFAVMQHVSVQRWRLRARPDRSTSGDRTYFAKIEEHLFHAPALK